MPYKDDEIRRIRQNENYKNNKKRRDYLKNYQKKYRRDMLNKVIDHYGSKCACCGESELLFLTIDHINNNGAQHRKDIKYKLIQQYLIENNYPDEFELLCWNCNCGKQRNGGICPHKFKYDNI